MQEGERGHGPRDHQRHIVVGCHIPQHTGQGVLLAPDFEIVGGLLERAATIEARGLFERIANAVIGLRDLAEAAAFVDNPGIGEPLSRRISVISRITVVWYCASVFSIIPRVTS